MKYLSLYLVFAYFGLICINGGGSLMQFFVDELVERRQWMTLDELGNFIAISQVTPGPIGINIATFLGYIQGGLLGGFLCTVGLLTPSFFLMTAATASYQKWQRSTAVQAFMYTVRPMSVTLVLTALCVHAGLSLLTQPIPFDALLSLDWSRFRALRIRYELIPIFIFAVWAFRRRVLPITSVIFVCAGAGILFHCGRLALEGILGNPSAIDMAPPR